MASETSATLRMQRGVESRLGWDAITHDKQASAIETFMYRLSLQKR